MDKRAKILLIVLGVLLLLGGGYVGYVKMTAEDLVATAPSAPAAKAAKTAKKETAPASPAPAESAASATEQAKTEAPAEPKAAAKPAETGQPEGAAAPADKTAKPAEKPAVAEKPAATGKPAEPGKQAPEAIAAKPAPCVPVLNADVKGKKVEFKSPGELVDKSGMDAKALAEFSAKNLAAASKKLDGLKKSKAAKEELDCAGKELEMAEKLVKLVEERFQNKPDKEDYSYSSLDKRDPFMSPMEIPRVYPKVPATAPPLERIPTESLKVAAIIWNEKGYRALILTNDDRGYTVKVGDSIGNKRGKVVRITEKNVYAEERIPDIFGDIEVRNIVLQLHKETK